MPFLIITNRSRFGNAIRRYLKHVFSDDSETVGFTALHRGGTTSFQDFDMVVAEVFDDSTGRLATYGLQYGLLFEAQQKPITYCFSEKELASDWKEEDLPANCYFLPKRLKAFLHALGTNPSREISSARLQQMFRSSSLTSSH